VQPEADQDARLNPGIILVEIASLSPERAADGPRLGYSPGIITRWPPGERVYGQPADAKDGRQM